MKKILLIAAAIFMAGIAQAQKVMTITKTDGTTVELSTADVQDIQFSDPVVKPIYVGKWKVKSIEYTPEQMYSEVWGEMVASFDGWPTLNTKDTFTITEEEMETSLSSELGNYFQAKSNLKAIDDYTINTGVGTKVTLKMVELDNVNRYFSATDESTDKVAQVGFAVNDDDDTLLDIYIIDFVSHSFAYTDFVDYEMYSSSKPTATMSGVYCKFTVEPVKE